MFQPDSDLRARRLLVVSGAAYVQGGTDTLGSHCALTAPRVEGGGGVYESKLKPNPRHEQLLLQFHSTL